MAITIEEKWDSRESQEGDNPYVIRKFVIRGTDDDVTAKLALATDTAIVYDGLVRNRYGVERIGQDIWLGTVWYGPWAPLEVGESVYQFDTSGGTQHVTQGIATMGAYGTGPTGDLATAADFGGAIGVTDSDVEGVDITVPVFSWSETHCLASDLITEVYRNTMANLTGTVNSGIFRGHAAGEVLFLGASGSKRGSEDWQITYRFAASPNRVDLTIGTITGIAKGGWQYLWVRYETNTDNEQVIRKPLAVYVEQVYPATDFTLLGLGV